MKKEKRKLVNFRLPMSVDNYLKRISNENHLTSTDYIIKLILSDKNINDISMIEKIIKELEKLKLFSIKTTKYDSFGLLFVDFKYDEDVTYNQEENTQNDVEVFTRKSELPEYIISYEENKNIIESLSKYIFDEYVDFILELTNRKINNDKTGICEKLNYKYDKTHELHTNQRRIVSKMLNGSNHIATDGRIGPANFAIMNNFTVDFLNKDNRSIVQNNESEESGFSYNIAGINVHICEKLEDGIILEGRCNLIDYPGVHLIINDEDINIDEEKREMKLKMKLIDVGFYPEKQFNQIRIDFSEMKKDDN